MAEPSIALSSKKLDGDGVAEAAPADIRLAAAAVITAAAAAAPALPLFFFFLFFSKR